MEYLALIYSDGQAWDEAGAEERAAVYAGYTRFSEDARAAGVLVGGAELASTATATTVRVRDGKEVVSDGPYAESKESLGGYFVLECPSLDAAAPFRSPSRRRPFARGASARRPCRASR